MTYYINEHYPLKSLGVPLGVAAAQFEYSKRGSITELRYYDETGAPCTNENGIAILKFGYDRNGFEASQDYYDSNGNRVYDAWRCKNDTRGRAVLVEFIGTNGCPAISKYNGCAKLRMRYDNTGRCIESCYYDECDAPMLCRASAISSWATGMFKKEHKRDELNGISESYYYGLDGKPCLCSRGYGGVRCIRNEYGEAYLEFLGLGGIRKNLPKEAWEGGGFFGFEQRFNSNGEVVWKMHFDEDYKYVMRRNECGFLDVRDLTGRKIARLHLGTDGKPHKAANGEWGWQLTADAGLTGSNQKRQPITDEGQAQKLFAQGMAAIVAPRNRFVEKWKKVRLEKVPKQ